MYFGSNGKGGAGQSEEDAGFVRADPPQVSVCGRLWDKAMIAEASGDYNKLLAIYNNAATLLNIYYSAGLNNEGEHLIKYASQNFERNKTCSVLIPD